MFEELLNKTELEELKLLLRELNALMGNCSSGDSDSCLLANKQYDKILLWKKKIEDF